MTLIPEVEANETIIRQIMRERFDPKPYIPFCNHLPRMLFTVNGTDLYIGHRTESVFDNFNLNLIIDCSNEKRYDPDDGFFGGNFAFPRMEEYVIPRPKVLTMAWHDFHVPPIGIKFWYALVKEIKGQSVAIVCSGGHGRSGTALACVLAAMGIRNPVQLIRNHYCKKAVETTAQENYVNNVLKFAPKKARPTLVIHEIQNTQRLP